MKIVERVRAFLNVGSRTAFSMITDTGNVYAAWNGNIYDSDIVRACILSLIHI